MVPCIICSDTYQNKHSSTGEIYNDIEIKSPIDVKVGIEISKKSSTDDRDIEARRNIMTDLTMCNTNPLDNSKNPTVSWFLVLQRCLVYPLRKNTHGTLIPIIVVATLGICILLDVVATTVIIATTILSW